MKNSDELLTTRLLDEESRIGPFFFQEFVLLFLALLSSALLVVVVSLFVEVPGLMIVLVPAGLLVLVGLLRIAFKGQITSPWYLHHWVARRFVRPSRLRPKTTQCPPKMVWLEPTLSSQPLKQEDDGTTGRRT